MGKDRLVDKDKERKHKKKKSKHHKKDNYQSSESESNSEEEWVEASTSSTSEKRDEWMNVTTFIPTVSRKELKKKNRKETESCSLSTIDKPGQHKRELNPYWKDGGTGLPIESSNDSNSNDKILPEKTVGDAGLNWLRRAYRRIKEQAEEENRNIEEVAAERWGSLEKLESLLAQAENKARENRYVDDNSDSKQPRWKKAYKKQSHVYDDQDMKVEKFKRNKTEAYDSYKKQFKKIDEQFDSYSYNSTSAKEQKLGKVAPKWLKKEFHDQYKSNISKESDKDADIPKNDPPIVKEHSVEKESNNSSLLTDKEMNELGAKLLKAEMLGNVELAEKLKLKMENARKARENVSSNVKTKSDETVLLVKTDSKGFTQPVSVSDNSLYTGKKKKQVNTYDAGGKRTCYFPDDDKYSLKQMFEKEKKTTSEDQNAEFARLYAKSTNDDDESFLNEASKIKPHLKQEQRDRSQAIHEHLRRSSALEKCQYCLDSSRMKKHLIISLGKTVYISLPNCQSLVDYHCYIVPMAHVTSGTLLDEDIWAEIQNFRKALIKMFDEMDKTAIFMETSIHHKWQPHSVIECIPVSKEDGDMAPMYFKKAIMESEMEWSLNKKLIDLYKKDLLHSVPKGLPYFSVEFGCSGGFAHVIEDERLFPSYFGKEVIGGMLDVEPVKWRKPPREPFENQCKKVLEFTEIWKKYDWTQKK